MFLEGLLDCGAVPQTCLLDFASTYECLYEGFRGRTLVGSEAIHVSTAQRYAHAAYRDGLDESTIRDLASLASWGRCMQNVERDLHRWAKMRVPGLQTHSIVVEVFDKSEGKTKEIELPIMLASDTLSALWGKGNTNLWDVCIGATEQNCSKYWSYAGEEWAQSHPVVQPLHSNQ